MPKSSNRRSFLKGSAALVAGTAAGHTQSTDGQPAPDDPTKAPGTLARAYGAPSRFEKTVRTPSSQGTSSGAPLQDMNGIITPSSLHFERHHAGVPDIDPHRHRLMIHGMVDRPLVLTMDEVKRFPSVSRVYVIECSGNGFRNKGAKTAQEAHGLVSCSEWTGVPLSLLLKEAGVQSGASWIVAEGSDAAKMTRSVPLAKAMNDVLLAYGQNGEAIRPEQGYPLRLFVPGWEGNISIKWLRRIKVVDQPYMTREETSKYTDMMPDGKARQFTFEMDPKSLITYPSGGHKLSNPGFYEITGLAWSGRGAIRKVEVSVDGGHSWRDAQLQSPVLPIAFTRFRFGWKWDGSEAVLQSRCTDEHGDVQPALADLVKARGDHWSYHFNPIQSWKVTSDGSVQNALT
ncbi:MAG TPA: sulfite dehydrogenase [Bryobacteraceae bacterium]|nr:sulfite dehydrogenase [Bryobacteraceae bacterium]